MTDPDIQWVCIADLEGFCASSVLQFLDVCIGASCNHCFLDIEECLLSLLLHLYFPFTLHLIRTLRTVPHPTPLVSPGVRASLFLGHLTISKAKIGSTPAVCLTVYLTHVL